MQYSLANKKKYFTASAEMILGHGIDIVDIQRIKATYEKFNTRFLQKFLSEDEMANIPDSNAKIVPFLAKHWAVKEAVSKAVGCGLINGSPLHFRDIILDYKWTGMPKIKTTKNLLNITSQMYGLDYDNLSKISFHVSTSGDAGITVASVILEII